jgi:hypothetical protein
MSVPEQAEQAEQAESGWKPPYVPYTTLTNFIEKKMGGGILPPRVDNGFLESYAGSVRPLLMSAMRTMEMISETGGVLDAMKEAAAGEGARRKVIKEWATVFYAEQQALAAKNATAQMLLESFSKHGYTGSTLRKAIVFYLALVDDVGLPKSPYFKAPKQAMPSGGTSRRTTPRGQSDRNGGKNSKGAAASPAGTPDDSGEGPGELVTVDLGEAGKVVVSVNVKWLSLDDKTFVSLRKAVNDLKALAAVNAAGKPPAPDEGAGQEGVVEQEDSP